MELELIRSYDQKGTNGQLTYSICNTIELPWLNNQRNVSCIPEGRYELRKEFSQKHQMHLVVMDVPGRSGILLHAANDALKELLGCIAPVTVLIGPGKGGQSRLATDRLNALVFAALQHEKVFITIKSKKAMTVIERVKAPTPKFFKVLRTIGISLAATSAAVLAAPVALPAGLITLAGYLAVAGTVATAVSQTAVEDSAKSNKFENGTD